jgi:putative ABC transport system permease protein
VGPSITLSNQSFTVVGVMPTGFQFPPDVRKDLWTSIAVDRESDSNIMTGRGYNALSVVARLKPGVRLTDAQADMDLIARRLALAYPENNAQRRTVRLIAEIERVVGSVRLPLLVILCVVGVVLLIACVNLANLSLARNLARQKEIAVRAALGAHRRRILGQLLTESLLLSLLGGVLGMALAAWGVQGLVRIAPEDLPRLAQVNIDWRVLAFALALSIVTGIVFGSVPALRASKTNLMESLKGASSAVSQGASQRRLRSGLVAVETALALILLVGAGLLISSYVRLVRVNPGFSPDNLLTFNFDLPMPPYTVPGAIAFVNQLLSRFRGVPRVQSAATDAALPFSGEGPSTGVEFEGRSFPPGSTPAARLDSVTPGYFQTMGIPLLSGRTFTERDDAASPPVVVVNDAFARHYFPNQSTVGKRIKPSFSATSEFPWREIVGVVGNTKQEGLAEDFQPEFYFPFAQVPDLNAVILRTGSNPLDVVPAIRSVFAGMDKNVPVYDVETMEGYVASSVARNRFSTLLLGLFGALALVLAAVGIYGVVSYWVSQSTHEIGIRMALGAEGRDVLGLVLGQGSKLVLIGVGVGIAGAFGLTRFLSSLLFGIKPTDPMIFIAVSPLLVGVALLASYIPARRAARVDPMVALRYEL